MADLIERSAVTEQLHKHFTDDGFHRDKWWNSYYVLSAIVDTPAVDAVPVVRCADCKHWEAHFGKYYCMVDSNRVIVRKADFYCFDGKRKDGKDEA